MNGKDFVRLCLARGWAAILRGRSTEHYLTPETALVVSPHADDETLGCGGLIAARAERGLRTHIVFLTDSGGTSQNAETRKQQAQIRRHEAISAVKILGAREDDITFLDAPDGQLDRLDDESKRNLTEGLALLIRKLNPEEIYLPFYGSHSTEHQAAHILCRATISASGWNGKLWEYPVWAWWNPPRFAKWFRKKPDPVALALGQHLETKSRALRAHASQHMAGGALPGILARICLGQTEFFFPADPAAGLPPQP
jgi:LmbE family N-acetylglucosaminyl deacetylase